MTDKFNVGSIVKARNREWIVLPSADEDTLLLRPIGGSEKEISGIYLPLKLETIESSSFPRPDITKIGDLASIKILKDAARLTFRSGAGPFRSLGKISVRPRPYQLVPLLMALKQDTIRLLIADDVGVGKTVEALLVAREMLDRGEIKSMGIVCPPHLCEQWQKELQLKFNICAVVIRSNTISQLERKLPNQSISVFTHNPFFITSIDYVKTDRTKENFLLNLPDLIIVDEAHTCTQPITNDKNQQQRWALVSEIASRSKQNLILLTATPHSGKEESFLSLIGHLDKKFIKLDLSAIATEDRVELAKYFIQRTRGDIEKYIGTGVVFPKRVPSEEPYQLSSEYSAFFKDVYSFLLGVLESGVRLAKHKQRVRYWAALGLLRSIMSSPDSGLSSLQNRIIKISESMNEEDYDDTTFQSYVSDPLEKEIINDLEPSNVLQEAEEEFSDLEKRKMKEFAERIKDLSGIKDLKLKMAAETVKKLIMEGYKPILFCRFIATAEYVAKGLKVHFPNHRIIPVTSNTDEEEREEKIKELEQFENRILVATDCLSEGVNLQDGFDAVIHYDLPWNPNRLEQREGRIDRYGQKTSKVKTILLYGEDNPIDGAVLEVLIRKAVKIHRTLGITVPVPVNSENVVQSVINSLFFKQDRNQQLALDFGPEFTVQALHDQWDRFAEREKESRTRFAQRSIKPDEVSKELEETDFVLGNPNTVKEFIISATQRLGGTTVLREDGITLNPNGFKQILREKIKLDQKIDIAFDFPIPDRHIEVGRNHPITSSLAEYVFESAFEANNSDNFYRCSAVRTSAVTIVSTFYLLRVRYLIDSPKSLTSLLAEELVTFGFSGSVNKLSIIDEAESNNILNNVKASDNIETSYALELIEKAVNSYDQLKTEIETLVNAKAERQLEAHTRLREITKKGKVKVSPQFPVDILGVIVLVPTPKGN